MASSNITERTHFAYFHEHGSFSIPAQGHASFEQHVGAGLRCGLCFLIVLAMTVAGQEICHLVGCHKDNDSSRVIEGRIEHLPDVGRALAGKFNGGCPLHRRQVDAPQKIKHRLAEHLVATVHDEYGAIVTRAVQ
ncbi:hypothetical protein AAHB34_20285 [Paenarthrobacter ureafaciens]